MRIVLALAALGVASAVTSAVSAQDRTKQFSAEFHRCEAADPSMVALSECLGDELDRQRIQLRAALREQGLYPGSDEPADLVESQQRWERAAEQDCQFEYNLGGSAAPMRQTSCLIALTIQRIEYLNWRGNW